MYEDFFENLGIPFVSEPEHGQSNYWLNAILFQGRRERDAFLETANACGVQARPVWALTNRLPMYRNCQTMAVDTAQWFEDRLVNLPSSVRS